MKGEENLRLGKIYFLTRKLAKSVKNFLDGRAIFLDSFGKQNEVVSKKINGRREGYFLLF